MGYRPVRHRRDGRPSRLDIDAIQRRWPDPARLILDALAQRPRDDAGPPDTGSLRTDLCALAKRMATILMSETGRKLHGGHLIGDAHIASMGIRRSAWRSRAVAFDVVFDRARQRGEMAHDVDHSTALEMLFAPINMRVLYIGGAVDEAYCEKVADLVCRAVSRG